MRTYNKYDIALGRVLTEKRKELHVTQQAIADHFGISRSLICNYEKGYRSMNASLFFSFCDFLKISPDDVALEVKRIVNEKQV